MMLRRPTFRKEKGHQKRKGSVLQGFGAPLTKPPAGKRLDGAGAGSERGSLATVNFVHAHRVEAMPGWNAAWLVYLALICFRVRARNC